jgi:hypothetical protein
MGPAPETVDGDMVSSPALPPSTELLLRGVCCDLSAAWKLLAAAVVVETALAGVTEAVTGGNNNDPLNHLHLHLSCCMKWTQKQQSAG